MLTTARSSRGIVIEQSKTLPSEMGGLTNHGQPPYTIEDRLSQSTHRPILLGGARRTGSTTSLDTLKEWPSHSE